MTSKNRPGVDSACPADAMRHTRIVPLRNRKIKTSRLGCAHRFRFFATESTENTEIHTLGPGRTPTTTLSFLRRQESRSLSPRSTRTTRTLNHEMHEGHEYLCDGCDSFLTTDVPGARPAFHTLLTFHTFLTLIYLLRADPASFPCSGDYRRGVHLLLRLTKR